MIRIDDLERLMKPKDDRIAALEADLAAAHARLERADALADAVVSFSYDLPPIMTPEFAPLWEAMTDYRASGDSEAG